MQALFGHWMVEMSKNLALANALGAVRAAKAPVQHKVKLPFVPSIPRGQAGVGLPKQHKVKTNKVTSKGFKNLAQLSLGSK